ncbi:MAG: hypothetical protein PHQ03_07390 [Methylococcales bacterium]|nr:hypothetical protein [Methylococcales bacterium]
MQTLEQIDAEIQKIINANSSSRFLKATLESALTRDPIGVTTDLEIAFMLLAHRLDAVLRESGEPAPA